ncbi:hypothetical protein [Streptomyces sp. NBC_00690]|uniref:hypothetical protein n=1 Tax=Streptomyces sp. NBC_00690 TaxID=2975808 RepID=UPI002E2DBDB3|nr:hypothetical protein [Streptomyces sp. NBC_00690]
MEPNEWGPNGPRLGLFVRIVGVKDAIGLAETTAMPRDAELRRIGTRVSGEVLGHAEHNH